MIYRWKRVKKEEVLTTVASKGSPPNGIRKGPHLSRSPPHVSTRATSIQNCFESAIAFLERQMHGIERLAMKLMQELKSMKDIL
ncbi:hypothetical protein LOK49_LG02G00477 [Camellia lanceoleosa]|uniref:Uncharacterized protein n=1 Tax=Camellia lanceoleosa TaxID=1840588 RepID=A0ACC0III6_9ERIC|nr:hypothetical protein LOK49_LG02G00477 [Camellia lanceoleosa]